MRDRFRIASVIVLVGFLQMTGLAQQKLLHGRVLDDQGEQPLSGSHIMVLGSASIAVSDKAGMFTLAWDPSGTMAIRVTHIGYENGELSFVASDVDAEVVHVIKLVRSSVTIPEVVIRRPAPEVVYQRQDLHVGDYFPNKDGLWVLAYERPQLWHREEHAGEQVFVNARLHLLDTLFGERCSIALPTRVRRLHRDHQDRVVVEGVNGAWFAVLEGETIVLHSIDRNTLHQAILPWTDSIPGYLLGNTRIPTFPAFDHIAYDPLQDRQFAICSVEDGHTMQLFRSQYKYMSGRDKVIAMDLELETGIDREVIAGYMTGFHADPYFHLPYAPLFVVNDTLCVFDHCTDRIRRFSTKRDVLAEVTMTHHHERGWRQRLVQDPVDDGVFAMYSRGMHTWLRSVDATSGRIGPISRLTHPFPEEVQVYGEHVYYVYRPYGSMQHRTLYREAMH